MSRKWMVVYPAGNYNLLSISHVLDYEKHQYRLASMKEFEEEADAAIYAQKLSKANDIPLSDDPYSSLLRILDLEEDENEQSFC